MAVLVTSLRSRQAVAASTLIEGRAVVVGNSGIRDELPIASYAAQNTTQGVYVAFFPPDNFPRPTYASMYTAPYKQTYNVNNNAIYGNPIFNELQYLIPRSQWKEPSIYSGELVALHWGKVGITSSCFTDSSNIKVPGNKVKVDTNGVFVYTSSANAVGEVEHYDDQNGVLYIILY